MIRFTKKKKIDKKKRSIMSTAETPDYKQILAMLAEKKGCSVEEIEFFLSSADASAPAATEATVTEPATAVVAASDVSHDDAVKKHDAAMLQHDAMVLQHDAMVLQHDKVQAAHDQAQAEHDNMLTMVALMDNLGLTKDMIEKIHVMQQQNPNMTQDELQKTILSMVAMQVNTHDPKTTDEDMGFKPESGEEKNLTEMFISVLELLLKNLVKVFGTCDKIPAFQRKLDLAKRVGKTDIVVKKWHSEVSPYYDAIENRNEFELRKMQDTCETFRELGIIEKFDHPGFTDGHKAWIFKVLRRLNRYSRLINGIPEDMMSNINNMAARIYADVENGSTDMMSLNPVALGQQILGDMSPESQMDLLRNLPNLLSAARGAAPINPAAMQAAIQGKSITMGNLFNQGK